MHALNTWYSLLYSLVLFKCNSTSPFSSSCLLFPSSDCKFNFPNVEQIWKQACKILWSFSASCLFGNISGPIKKTPLFRLVCVTDWNSAKLSVFHPRQIILCSAEVTGMGNGLLEVEQCFRNSSPAEEKHYYPALWLLGAIAAPLATVVQLSSQDQFIFPSGIKGLWSALVLVF